MKIVNFFLLSSECNLTAKTLYGVNFVALFNSGCIAAVYKDQWRNNHLNYLVANTFC